MPTNCRDGENTVTFRTTPLRFFGEHTSRGVARGGADRDLMQTAGLRRRDRNVLVL
jgi:hypothetical protein